VAGENFQLFPSKRQFSSLSLKTAILTLKNASSINFLSGNARCQLNGNLPAPYRELNPPNWELRELRQPAKTPGSHSYQENPNTFGVDPILKLGLFCGRPAHRGGIMRSS
jgi:hypothetical protein